MAPLVDGVRVVGASTDLNGPLAPCCVRRPCETDVERASKCASSSLARVEPVTSAQLSEEKSCAMDFDELDALEDQVTLKYPRIL